MPQPFAPLSEFDVPVENLFFIDQLTNTEQALHLLNQHLRGRWPLHDLAAAMQGGGTFGNWAEPLGYGDDEVLHFDSISIVDHRPLFRARLASYYGQYSESWMQHRVQEDFTQVTRPGTAGILLGCAAPNALEFDHVPVYGYLLAVHLHQDSGNNVLQLLQDENIMLCGDLAVTGGWLNTDALHGFERPDTEHEY